MAKQGRTVLALLCAMGLILAACAQATPTAAPPLRDRGPGRAASGDRGPSADRVGPVGNLLVVDGGR